MTTDFCNPPFETRDALIEKRKQEIILERMEDEDIVRESIASIADESVRSGVIDRMLCKFFRKCFNARLADRYVFSILSSERQKPIMDAATSLFDELFDRIYYDILEEDALKQAEKEIDALQTSNDS